MKLIQLTLIFLFISIFSQAQKVVTNGVVYEVKNNTIYKGETNVTDTLSKEQQKNIFHLANKINKAKKDALEAEKEIKRKREELEENRDELEKSVSKDRKKEIKAREKEIKAREKALKLEKKAHKRFLKWDKKHQKAQKKYTRLLKKGKLSPVDEENWLKKLDKIQKKLEKAKEKLTD